MIQSLCQWRWQCLDRYISLEAFTIKRTFWFSFAVTCVMLFSRCLGGVCWKNSFVVGSNYCFHVWHARLAQFQCVPIEDLVQWMVLGEAFVNDENRKLLSQVWSFAAILYVKLVPVFPLLRFQNGGLAPTFVANFSTVLDLHYNLQLRQHN